MQPENVRAEERSLATLLKELSQETSNLAQKEVSLARVEIMDKVSQVGSNIAALAIASAILLAGLIVLLDAAVLGLAVFLPWDYDWVAPLIVGLVVLIIGYTMLQKSKSNLESTDLTPRRASESVRQDKEFIKEAVR